MRTGAPSAWRGDQIVPDIDDYRPPGDGIHHPSRRVVRARPFRHPEIFPDPLSRGCLTDAPSPSVQVDEGDTYKLSKAERDAIMVRTTAKTRAERIKQVREQEKLWARHKAREYRSSVKDHHAELNAQLHDGWVKARDEKQKQLERDYSNAAAGIGRAQRAAQRQAVEDKRVRAARAQREAQKFDNKLVALERFETALKKEYERLDELESPLFKARDRRNKAEQLAKNVRTGMRDKWEKDERDGVHTRRDAMRTMAEAGKSRRVYRPDAFKMTHFNDIMAGPAPGPKQRMKYKEKMDGGPGAPTAYAGDWFPRDAAGAYVVKREQAFGAKLKAEREQARLEDERLELAERTKKERALYMKRSAKAIQYERAARDEKPLSAQSAEIREEGKEKIKNIGKVDAAEEEKQARAAQQEMERDFQFKDIDEPTGPSASGPSVGFDDAAPFEGMFDEKQEDARLDQILSQGLDPDDPLLKVLQMAKEAVPRGAAAERLARHGVVGSTMEEIAAIAHGGDDEYEDPVCQPVPFQGPAPPSPRVIALSEDSDSDDEDGYTPSGGGAGLPPGESNFYSDAQLDAALAAVAARNNTPSRFGITEDEDEESAARRSAEELDFVSSALQDDTMNTTGVFSRSGDEERDFRDLPDQGGFGSPEERSPRAAGAGPVSESTAVVSTVPGASSSSGTAEEEMKASLAATTRAMDRVTAAASAAEYNLHAASLLASADTGMPGRVEIPELKPLDAILGALGKQVEALDAAAAAAARAAAEPSAGSFTSSDIISQAEASLEGRTPGLGFEYDETVSTEMGDTSAMYAAASAAALNSAPPTEASAHAATPGGGADGTPGGAATATTPQSAGGSDYKIEPQRDASAAVVHSATPAGIGQHQRRNFLSTEPEIASIAAKIAAAAYAQNPGEAPETVAKRVAAAMTEALEAQKATRSPNTRVDAPGSPALWDESDGNVDSSWARALGALDNEWAKSVVDIAPVPKTTSPPRYADTGYDDEEEEEERVSEEEERASVSTLAPPVRVPLDASDPSSTRPEGVRVGGGGWGGLDRSADTEMSLSLDGRSLAALANASFDVPTDEENDMFISDSDVEGSNAWEDFKTTVFTPTRAKKAPAPQTTAKVKPAKSKKGKPPAAPAFKARVQRLAAKEQAKAKVSEPVSPEDEAAAAEERMRKRKEAAALRKKAAAFDRRNREHLQKLQTLRKK